MGQLYIERKVNDTQNIVLAHIRFFFFQIDEHQYDMSLTFYPQAWMVSKTQEKKGKVRGLRKGRFR